MTAVGEILRGRPTRPGARRRSAGAVVAMAFVLVFAGAWPGAAVGPASAATSPAGPDVVALDPAVAAGIVPTWPDTSTNSLGGRDVSGSDAGSPCTTPNRPGSRAGGDRPALLPGTQAPSAEGVSHRGASRAQGPGAAPRVDCTLPHVNGPRGGFLPTSELRAGTSTRISTAKPVPTTPRVSLAAATYTLSGKVTDPASAPIADIEVQASGVDNWNSAITAADGTFSIDVTPDTYLVSFYDWSQTYANGWYGSGGFQLAETAATPVGVTTASVANINAKLPLNYHVSGTIKAAGTGTPLPDITVIVASGSYASSTMTAGDGTYSVGIPAGTYTVRVDDQTVVYGAGYWSTGGFTRNSASASPLVMPPNRTGINLSVPKNPRITGKVTAAVGGTALANISVSATTSDEWLQVSNATTAADGTYVMPVPPGTYLVEYSDPATVYAGGYYSTAGVTTDSSSATIVTVVSADRTGISAALPKAVHIKGKLTGPGGVAAGGISVSANGLDGNNTTESAADGTYSVAVQPGIYQLAVSDYRGQPDAYPSGFYGTGGFTLDPGASAGVIVTTADITVNLAMPRMVLVKGKVTGPGGVAVAGISVISSARMYSSEATTAADGTYALPVPANGNWSIQYYDSARIYTSGFYATAGFTRDPNAATSITVGTAAVAGINIQLPKNLLISGKVTRAGGAGIPNVNVYAGAVGYGQSARTAADGTYTIGVPAGTYTVSFADFDGVYAPGYYGASGFSANTSKRVTVGSSGVAGVSVQLPAFTIISGTVANTGGTGLGGITVRAEGDHHSDASSSYTATTASNGSYSLRVPPGLFVVSFTDPTGVRTSAYYAASGVTLDRNRAARLSVGAAAIGGIGGKLGSNVKVSGKVTGPGGVNVANAWVSVFSTLWQDWARTAADGSYSVPVPPNGDYGIRFEDPASHAAGYYGAAGLQPTTATATAVHVAATSVSGINARLAAAHKITGRVTGAGVSGLPGITVCADSVVVSACVATKADGSYAVTVPPGGYTIQFQASPQSYGSSDGWGGTFSDGYYAASGFTTRADQASIVTVGSANVGGINTVISRNLRITGRVTAPNGVGIAGVYVFADRLVGRSYAVTGPDGRYTIDAPAGAYTISYDAYWMSSWYPYGYYGPSGFTIGAAATVNLTGATVSGINVTLPRPVWITGRVAGAGGAGMGGIVASAETSTGYGNGAMSEDDGNFAVLAAAGTYTVSYVDDWWQGMSFNRIPNGYYSSTGFTLSAAAATKLVVGTSNRTSINATLPAGRRISGFVTGSNKLPVEGIQVTAKSGTYSVTEYTDNQGAYVLPVPAGSYLVSFLDPAGARAGGYYSTTGLVSASASATAVSTASADVSGINVALPLATGATYHALTPYRVLDSRISRGGTLFHSRVKQTVTVATAASKIPATAVAVVGNVTVTGQTRGGYVSLAPALTSGVVPATSTINFPLGDSRANGVTLPLAAGGKLDFMYWSSSTADTAQVIFDVTGYFSNDATGATYHALTPYRVLDSRISRGGTLFHSRVKQTVTVATAASKIPATAVAVVGNVTVTGQTRGGYVSLAPALTSGVVPATSTINFPLGDSRANGVTLPLAAGGKLDFMYWSSSTADTAQVIFDVTGYFSNDATGATYHALTPYRVLDSRISRGGTLFHSRVKQTVTVATAASKIPATAVAVVGNVTVTGQTRGGYVSLAPALTSGVVPATSTINFPLGDSRANGVTLPLAAGGKLDFMYWSSSTADTAQVIFDVTGYFTK